MVDAENSEDEELIEKAKADRHHFGALYTKYGKNVYHFFWFRVNKNKEIAEDLMQETFLRAYKNISAFKNMGYKYSSYLFRIAHNLLVNHYRRPKELPLGQVEIKEMSTEDNPNFVAKERAEAVYAIVKTFPEHEQKIFTLRYIEDLKIEDIAKHTGKSENAIKLLLCRNRKKLKQFEKSDTF